MHAPGGWAEGLPPGLVIAIIATVPILELRAAMPVAILHYKMPFVEAVAWSILGNIFPIPFILLLLGPVERYLRRWAWWDRFFTRLFDRTVRQMGKRAKRLEAIGLVLFVGIPLPMTGAWTGALAVHIFRLGHWLGFAAILAGVALAATIVGMITVSASWILESHSIMYGSLAVMVVLVAIAFFWWRKRRMGDSPVA